MKYPEGSIITKDGEKRKVLGACGEVRFVSASDLLWVYQEAFTVEELENRHYVEEQKPWEPLVGFPYCFLTDHLSIVFREWKGEALDYFRLEEGNAFDTEEKARAARDRVRKALKNEH